MHLKVLTQQLKRYCQQEKILTTIQNALNTLSANCNAKSDLRSDGPHQGENGGMSLKTRADFLKLNSFFKE